MTRTGKEPTRPSRAARGFSLIEVIVVVAIMGVIAMIGIGQLSKALARQLVASGASDSRTAMQRVRTEGQNRNVMSFLRIAPPNANGTTPLQVIIDSNNNSQLDVGTDRVILDYPVAADLVVASPAPAGVTGATTWDQWIARATNDHYVGCDFLGRTVNPTTGVQVVRPARIELTHAGMVSGKITPQVTYTLSVNPVWNVAVSQRLGP